MATTQTVTSNYKGTTAGEIIGKSFKECDILKYLTVYEGINYDLNLRRIQYTNGRRAYTCGFAPAGTIVLDEKVLKPKKFTNDFDGCMEDFRATWSDEKMGMSAMNAMPADIEAAILAEVLSSESQDLCKNVWSGDSVNPGEFDGFLKLFTADETVVGEKGPAITEANVEAELKKALSAVDSNIRNKDLSVFVASDVFQAYSFYLISKGIANTGDAFDKEVRFGKYTLIEAELPDGNIVIAEKANLTFGTGLTADFNNIYIDSTSAERILDGMYKGKIVYSAGVQYYFGSEIVWRQVSL